MLETIQPPAFAYGRKEGFQIALSLIKDISNPVILEIGMIRGIDEAESNGHSTKVFADFIKKIRVSENKKLSQFISIDILQEAIMLCENELIENELDQYAKLICADALTFMREAEVRRLNSCDLSKIDLLYVDGWDYSTDEENNIVSEASTLEFIKLSEAFLSHNAVILFDDVYDDEWAGKAKKAIPHLLNNNWICVFRKNNQALLIRNIFKTEDHEQ